MNKLLTPKQVALAIGVSEASIKRWCDRGLLAVARTAGGHRRLERSTVVQFVRDTEHRLVRPELLGLPVARGHGEATAERVTARFREALENGETQRARQIILNLYLDNRGIVEIADRIIAPALDFMGKRWEHGDVQIYQERRACEICMRILHELCELVPQPKPDAVYALGGTLSGDQYTLPTMMVELTLRELGIRADNTGCNQPAETLAAAICDRKPQILWLSVSHIESPRNLIAGFDTLHQAASSQRTAMIVGGRALTESIRRKVRYTAFCDNLGHLADFVNGYSVKGGD